MPLTNYTDLQASVGSWLNRSDLTTQIKDFIAMAESRFRDRLRARDMIEVETLSVSGRYTDLPADFLEMKSVYLTTPLPKKLTLLSKDQLNEERAKNIDSAGSIKFAAVVGNKLEVFSTPSSSVDLELSYFQSVPALSDAALTNWLLTKYPDLYLYGALISSAPFLHDDDRFQLWVTAHDTRLEEINRAGTNAQFTTPVQRIRAIS